MLKANSYFYTFSFTLFSTKPNAGTWEGVVLSWAGPVISWAGAVMSWAGAVMSWAGAVMSWAEAVTNQTTN